MEVEIVTGARCAKCQYLKEHLPKDARIMYFDQKSAEGLTVLAYHELINSKLPLPIIVIDDVPQLDLIDHETKTVLISRAVERIREALE